jgi:hypothetical protein
MFHRLGLKSGQCYAKCTSVGSFLSSHYKLLLAVFSIATKDVTCGSSLKHHVLSREKSKQSPEANGFSNDDSLLSDIIKSCAESLLPVHSNVVKSTALEQELCASSTLTIHTGALGEKFIQQLNHCEDASISCYILDLLSILFIHTECSRGILPALASRTLHSVYTRSAGKANLPYILFKLRSIFVKSTNSEDESARTSVVKETFALLINSSNVLLRAKDSFSAAFVHHLLAQWSAHVIEGMSQRYCLTEMVDSLDAFLAGSFRRPKQNNTSRPRAKTALPGLNKKTYTSLFELMLHMISTSLSLSTPHRVKKKASSNIYHVKEPYEEIIWPMEVHGKLLSIFQTNHMYFPRRFISTTVKVSSIMIKLGDFQLRQCVQWRNSQPTLMGIGMDSAAVELLQPLIDCVASHCIGNIISFCNIMKIQPNCDNGGFGSDYKHTKAIAGLLYGCERIKETLQVVCQAQNLIFPKDFTSAKVTRDSSKRNRGVYEDVYEPGRGNHRSNREFSTPRNIRPRGSHDKTPKSPSIPELLPKPGISEDVRYDSIKCNSFLQSDSADSEESSLHSDADIRDEEMLMQRSDDDDSFGVIGDWGT